MAIANGDKIMPTDDAQVQSAAYFWKRRSRGPENDVKRCRYALAVFPAISAAYEVFRRRQPLRWAIEALVVSAVDVQEIASLFGMSVSTIRTYAGLFYDVLEHVKSPGWVSLNLIGDNPDRMGEPGYALLWKKLAVRAGPQVVLDFITKFAANADADGDLQRLTQTEARKRLAVASHRLNINDKDFARIYSRVRMSEEPKTILSYLGLNDEACRKILQGMQRRVINPLDLDHEEQRKTPQESQETNPPE